jgi:hypothetical protein
VAVTAANIDVTCVVVALSGVLQQINRTDGEADLTVGATGGGRGVRNVCGQNGAGDEADLAERTAWADGSRSRRRIVDEMRALQVDAVRTQVADFESGLMAEAFLHRSAPLLDVL